MEKKAAKRGRKEYKLQGKQEGRKGKQGMVEGELLQVAVEQSGEQPVEVVAE